MRRILGESTEDTHCSWILSLIKMQNIKFIFNVLLPIIKPPTISQELVWECLCIQGEIGICKKKEETEIPGENSHKARIRTNNKHTHVWHLCWYSNLGHICVSWMLLLWHNLCTLHTSGATTCKSGPKGTNDQLQDSLGTHDSLKGSGTQLLINNNFKKIQT